MGRQKANALTQFWEVRIRENRTIRGIQVQANNAQHAAKRVSGHVISVRKIKPDDVIGNLELNEMRILQGNRQGALPKDTYSEDWNLTDIFFNSKKNK